MIEEKLNGFNDTLINSYIKFASTPMEENPEIQYFGYNLNENFIFDNWEEKMKLDTYIFRFYNSFCRLCLKLNEPEEKGKSMNLVFFSGDWKERIIFNNSDLTNAEFIPSGNSTKPFQGNTLVEIFLNPTNYEMAKNKGLIIFGNGLVVEKVYISGPRFLKMEPKKIIKSQERQKLIIYFNEDATNLTNNIIFENINYNINDQISCEVDKGNVKRIFCQGIFNFTGEYTIKDSNDYLFTNRKLLIIAKSGEKNNINNLIDSKINFDDEKYGISVQYSNKTFSKINNDSKLFIETNDLFFEPKFKTLYIYQGKTDSIIKFAQNKINMKVRSDNGIEIPSGNHLITIDLSDNYNIIKDNGITIKGYGFSLKNIYFNEQLNNENEAKGGIKIWIIILVAALVFLLILIIVIIIIKKKSGKNIEEKVDGEFSKNEKILKDV